MSFVHFKLGGTSTEHTESESISKFNHFFFNLMDSKSKKTNLRLFHTPALLTGIMVESEPHLVFTTRANATILVLPVAHAFPRCGGYVAVLTKTFGQLGTFVGCVCRPYDGDHKERGHDDPEDYQAVFRYHDFGIWLFFLSFRDYFSRFLEFSDKTHAVSAVFLEIVPDVL